VAVILVVVFLVVPLVELAVILQVARNVGVAVTLLGLIGVSVLGAWLVRREGAEVWRRFRAQVGAGVVPGREIADGAMILFAGALLLTPGFVTDLLGLLLLVPAVRRMVRATLIARLVGRVGMSRRIGRRRRW
jgi:UPF0716 protein FxsA